MGCLRGGSASLWPVGVLEGDAAFEARSRLAPHLSHHKVCDETVELAVNLRAELVRLKDLMLALTPLPGTCSSVTRSPCRHRRYGAASSIWAWWSPTRRNARSRPMSGSKQICPTRCGSRTSPTGASLTGADNRDHHLARRPFPLRTVSHRAPAHNRPDRCRHLQPNLC